MDFIHPNISSFHNDVLQNTLLGQLCGKDELFCDRYKILRMLGRGGFGVTFLAQQQYNDQSLCVIKQLCPKVQDSQALQTARRRFHQEARILERLGNHSQIPQLLEDFVIGEDFYLVQEYIQGMTLARRVRRYGPYSETALKGFLQDMLNLLSYVHNHKVIHRDIKPQNVIYRQEDSRLVLIDFGAVKAQISLTEESTFKARTTHFIGTVGFASPELYSLHPVFASDIYALGVTCLYLLTGKGPLDFHKPGSVGARNPMEKLQWKPWVKVSYPLLKILDKMLNPDLKERYSSMVEIQQDLNHISPPPHLPNRSKKRTSIPKNRHRGKIYSLSF